ncbi:hypothetical protein F1D05_16920 [Kribbella qitaiheensis]|uniref:Uncharacterized protein n=1 Tax=Kribbella qitaiheensis TaxID=1544730 RepID=A0A7G6WZ74_9ACTN|nr:hypothetical protein [Kribbella qitaiheensis]QNE19289.1 hypothetical protein F1D05_16920 [Kribbella qitaiheensis]
MSEPTRRAGWALAAEGTPERELAPDEELARRLDLAEQALGTRQHRWFARATLLAALATGITLLLPWTFSRRLGESVWQLGVEVQPSLLLTWLAGLIASILALTLRPGHAAQACTAITGVIALIHVAGSWQATAQDSLSDTWPGPGPAFAIVAGLSWILCVSAQLIADHPHPSTPTDESLQTAISRLRHTR